jgi:hypothetical protein
VEFRSFVLPVFIVETHIQIFTRALAGSGFNAF